MKLEDLNDQLDADLKIDSSKLQWEASNNPLVYSKWLRVYSAIKKEILAQEAAKKVMVKKRLDYYTGRSDDEISMVSYEKSEMKTVMSADAEILKIETKLQYYMILLDFATRALDIVKSRGFSIKHMVDIRSLEAGK
ncbi:recombination, repair and ssDNA binding protein [Serratia phage PS2]|uniref:Recombination, repair and ssDNA binding protein n=1 Tax=Serratia phage PS2 TaxID=1481112 RepID=A0A023W5A6_9CAUD|nr:UvsY-like recombination mediator [Serratia phage PS2]AHY25524.1 recombination, repair and ssDNA binding protein [Serratia phage PS2]